MSASKKAWENCFRLRRRLKPWVSILSLKRSILEIISSEFY